MPIALDSLELAPVSLRSDAEKPEAERPAFLFRHLTRRQVRQAAEWIREAMRVEQEDGDAEPLLDKIILFGLAGWRNMDTDYAPDKLDDVLTFDEKIELALNYPRRVAEVEAKKKSSSASPPSGATAPSAAAAPAEPAAPKP